MPPGTSRRPEGCGKTKRPGTLLPLHPMPRELTDNPTLQEAAKIVPAWLPQERFSGLIRRNDELSGQCWEKCTIVAMLKRSLQAVNQSFNQASDPELDRRLHFFGEETTVRRIYLRLLGTPTNTRVR